MPVINEYFDLMRSGDGARYFYCCNRVEKKLPDGSVIRYNDYPWSADDTIVIDELCPWYQKYPVSLPPFWKPFAGPIRHRLVQLEKQK